MFKSKLVVIVGILLSLVLIFGSLALIRGQSLNAGFAALTKDKSLFSFSGTRPTDLGVKDGKLAPCPGTPNCVNSQGSATDAEHSIAPLKYEGDAGQAIATLKTIVNDLDRTQVISESDRYFYAEFTSALMGFVDDVEFYADPSENVIHIRSASRLGESDLGVNRKRVEDIRAKFEAAQA